MGEGGGGVYGERGEGPGTLHLLVEDVSTAHMLDQRQRCTSQ